MARLVPAIDVEGHGGADLRDAWSDGPLTQLGLVVPGFPNYLMVNGSGNPSALTNMFVSIEHYVEWIGFPVTHLAKIGATTIEPSHAVAATWMQHVGKRADTTLFRTFNSWFSEANIPGKRRAFLPLRDYRLT